MEFDEEELASFIDGLEYHIKLILQDIERLRKRLNDGNKKD